MELEESNSSDESAFQEDEEIIEEDLEPFSELIIVNKLEESDLDCYNEEEYEKYVLKDQNEIRKTYGIPERDLNTKFSLFRDGDFLIEYKSMFYNTNFKELLDHKFLVASDFM